jgi:hypothetical protein
MLVIAGSHMYQRTSRFESQSTAKPLARMPSMPSVPLIGASVLATSALSSPWTRIRKIGVQADAP